jgi:hypothetical protein
LDRTPSQSYTLRAFVTHAMAACHLLQEKLVCENVLIFAESGT